MMEPVDEFQFKPLTEGLGFHKKNKQPLKADKGLDDILVSKSASLEMLETPLPRKNLNTEERIHKSSVDEILRTLSDRRKLNFKDDRKKQIALPAKQTAKWKASSWELPAFLLDTMLLAALVLTALISLLMITKIDLSGNLINPDQDGMVYLSLATLLVGFAWIYMVTSRIFMGSTPGEWVFDQRVGLPEQFGSAGYQLKVALRSILVVATGFVLFPFLSVLFDRDILGKMTGLELVKRT